jgi:hypothetical protein
MFEMFRRTGRRLNAAIARGAVLALAVVGMGPAQSLEAPRAGSVKTRIERVRARLQEGAAPSPGRPAEGGFDRLVQWSNWNNWKNAWANWKNAA